MILKPSEDLKMIVGGILDQIAPELRSLLPFAEIHHIGATAISGAMTKGDLDILLRVDASEFKDSVLRLGQHFEVRQPQNWDSFFASFGDDQKFELPLGLQLVIKDSEADFILFVQNYLGSHPEILAEYNRVKLNSAAKSTDEYWEAKDRVLAPIVELHQKQFNQST